MINSKDRERETEGRGRYIEERDVAALFPARPPESNKGDFGYVALIGGSLEYSGAIRLAGIANSEAGTSSREAGTANAVAGIPAAAAAADIEGAAGEGDDRRAGEAPGSTAAAADAAASPDGLASRANAAMRSGAGVATIAAPRSICPVIANSILEATLFPLSDDAGELRFEESEFARICRRYKCIAFGMGIGNSVETRKAVEYLLGHYGGTLIIDADGLNALASIERDLIRGSAARLLLTPHVKEFSRLSGMSIEDIKADPVSAACCLADDLNAVVLLKGSTTVVAGPASDRTAGNSETPDARRILMTGRGCPGMATAGSGDVLSGILAAICVNTDDLVLAGAAGAYINGAAGELAQSRRSAVTMTASDTARCVAEVIENIIGM